MCWEGQQGPGKALMPMCRSHLAAAAAAIEPNIMKCMEHQGQKLTTRVAGFLNLTKDTAWRYVQHVTPDAGVMMSCTDASKTSEAS